MHNNSFLPLSFFFLLLFFFIYGSNIYFCVWGRGAQAPFYPTLDLPLLYLKKSKKVMLEANRDTPTKPHLVDDLVTTY